MSIRRRITLWVCVCAFALVISQVAPAQYMPGTPTPGGTGTTPIATSRSYGMNKAMIGAGVGGAAAGGILLYALRHRGVYEGCVGDDGKSLTRKDGTTFQLKGEKLQPGEKVSLKAKKDTSDSSGETLEVVNVRKDKGACERRVASTTTPQH